MWIPKIAIFFMFIAGAVSGILAFCMFAINKPKDSEINETMKDIDKKPDDSNGKD